MESLIQQIYEAAIIAEKWPSLLEEVGERFHSRGALLFTLAADGTCWRGGGAAADFMEEFLSGEWMGRNERPARVRALGRPGFVTELDVMSEQELLHDPVCEQFMRPRGFAAAAGTYVPGLAGEDIMLSVEGFCDYDAARAAVPALDALRPHLARAIQLADQFRLQTMHGHVQALQAIGAAACVIDARGAMVTANLRFQDELGTTFREIGRALCLQHRRAQQQFAGALARLRAKDFSGCSIPIRARPGPIRVLHVLPLAGAAHDLFARADALLVLTNPGRCVPVSAECLQRMFDLTPAEARLAVMVGSRSATLAQIATEAGLSINTAKSQIRSVFQKTGTDRQADLVRLLIGAGSICTPVDGGAEVRRT
ncbi:helix-turn-helix transcriptional regulator [Pseudoduganella plicata]|uniref:Helix-turn-helix transcriptional regulator n=1 Tax=Pseudoduganella plicata TaxID=321984 RepID=A0A4P7BC99_9BURK|nr:helix-turn-helix transcriptional regulator [Pseudoduganella plicata]QBQ35517.1 helix-turn-helix transcriptional regulator [Pseudoduganella plicata]GGY97241.1 LuxR family transcriptional regulator [Pseudoduganella plicata]